jgi:dihydroorotate dehydrogenase (NAD+) catalytic subunit
MTPDLRVRIGPLELKNPVMPASGTWGVGPEDPGLFDVAQLGAVVTKTLMIGPREGNAPLRVVETPAGMLNSVGLPSHGLDAWLEEVLPDLRALDTVRVASLGGHAAREFVAAIRAVDEAGGVDAYELNLSCPNLGRRVLIAEDEGLLAEVVAACRAATARPLIAKLSPNVLDMAAFARTAEEAGADAVTVANTLRAMAIDTETRRPLLGTVQGGISGPAVRPIIVWRVWEVSRAVRVPVVAAGGAADARDAVEFLLAGATAVQFGTVNFVNPLAMRDAVDGLRDYCLRHGVARVADLVGAARPAAHASPSGRAAR